MASIWSWPQWVNYIDQRHIETEIDQSLSLHNNRVVVVKISESVLQHLTFFLWCLPHFADAAFHINSGGRIGWYPSCTIEFLTVVKNIDTKITLGVKYIAWKHKLKCAIAFYMIDMYVYININKKHIFIAVLDNLGRLAFQGSEITTTNISKPNDKWHYQNIFLLESHDGRRAK